MAVSKMAKSGIALMMGLGLGVASPSLAQGNQAQDNSPNNTGLASASLADGQASTAIQMLETEIKAHPNDPALRINLGIAHAQLGNDAEARVQFEAAMNSREAFELETANGRTTNSRKLARHAMAMLDRGEFQPATAQTGRLTLRD